MSSEGRTCSACCAINYVEGPCVFCWESPCRECPGHGTSAKVPRWRVGRSLGRTLYCDGAGVGIVDTPELAAELVRAANAAAGEREAIIDFLRFEGVGEGDIGDVENGEHWKRREEVLKRKSICGNRWWSAEELVTCLLPPGHTGLCNPKP
jgi:hypothetical protein